MNIDGFAKLGTGAKKAAMQLIAKAASGAAEEPLFSEQDSGLQFEKLKAAAAASGQKASTASGYMEALLLHALYRDAKYAHETRGFLSALGTNNAMRGHYEALRVYVALGGS
jgi:hypothetical protein